MYNVQPIEDGVVQISRAAGTVSYPAKFTMIAAANPCPCGNYGSDIKRCTCLPGMITRYQKRISGPIIDRIDLHVHVPAVNVDTLSSNQLTSAEKSSSIQSRVQKARNIQTVRFHKLGISSNNEMSTKHVKEFCFLNVEVAAFLKRAASQFGLSARSYYRLIKVARTIADLSGQKIIDIPNIAEALQYRPKENNQYI